VKITIHSYKTLKKVYEFTLGFNTLNIDHLNDSHKGVVRLENSDLYDRSGDTKDEKIAAEVLFDLF
jgi:hypothetical protein